MSRGAVANPAEEEDDVLLGQPFGVSSEPSPPTSLVSEWGGGEAGRPVSAAVSEPIRPDQPILVVESSPTQALALGHLLEEAGYSVVIAHDGHQALALMSQIRPLLVLADGRAPGLDGFELCERVKAESTSASVPVILVSAASNASDLLRALKVGANNFLTKPYQPEYLLDRVEDILTTCDFRRALTDEVELEVVHRGDAHRFSAVPEQILDLLLSTHEHALSRERALQEANDRLKHTLALNRSLQQGYKVALQSNSDAIVICGPGGRVEYANPAAVALFTHGSLLEGDHFQHELVDGVCLEVELPRPTGEPLIAELRVSTTHWEGRDAFLVSARDVTGRARMRSELQTIAFRDGLTGLHNRRGFVELAGRTLAEADRTGTSAVLFYADMDGLKWINDTLGHALGDQALTHMAGVLSSVMRSSDLVARLGGDEFVALARNTGPEQAEVIVARLTAGLDAHNARGETPYDLALSLGVVHRAAGDPRDLEELLETADRAMYHQKRARRRARGEAPAGQESASTDAPGGGLHGQS